MIDHLGVNVADLAASARFYDTVLATRVHPVAGLRRADRLRHRGPSGLLAELPAERHLQPREPHRLHRGRPGGRPGVLRRCRIDGRRGAARPTGVAGVPPWLLRRSRPDPDGNNVEAVWLRLNGISARPRADPRSSGRTPAAPGGGVRVVVAALGEPLHRRGRPTRSRTSHEARLPRARLA